MTCFSVKDLFGLSFATSSTRLRAGETSKTSANESNNKWMHDDSQTMLANDVLSSLQCLCKERAVRLSMCVGHEYQCLEWYAHAMQLSIDCLYLLVLYCLGREPCEIRAGHVRPYICVFFRSALLSFHFLSMTCKLLCAVGTISNALTLTLSFWFSMNNAPSAMSSAMSGSKPSMKVSY